MLNQLSPPLELKGDNIEEVIESIYQEFYNTFLNKDVKPLYKGKFIFFNMSRFYGIFELSWPERFMHIGSIEDKGYEIFPCNNDISKESCESNCEQTKASMEFITLRRIECLYRLSRLNWIPEVINMANNGNENIMSWCEEDKDKRNNKVVKQYVRYMSGMHDFLIILEKSKIKGNECYKFITAYPIFLKREGNRLMQSYLKHQKK